jgi:hypothetical protein
MVHRHHGLRSGHDGPIRLAAVDTVALTRMIHHTVHTLCRGEKRLFGNNPKYERRRWQIFTVT